MRPLVFSDEVREQWVNMRHEGYTIPQIAERTGASIATIQKYFCSIGITNSKSCGKSKKGDEPYDDTPDCVIKIFNLYLEPDAAIRYLELRARLGIAGTHWEALDGEQGLEKELELGRFLVINKNDINKNKNSVINLENNLSED